MTSHKGDLVQDTFLPSRYKEKIRRTKLLAVCLILTHTSPYVF